jgi:hypothetical protein
VQRNRENTGVSVIVRPHRVGDIALLQAVLLDPGIGGLDRASDMIGCSREIVGRSDQRA